MAAGLAGSCVEDTRLATLEGAQTACLARLLPGTLASSDALKDSLDEEGECHREDLNCLLWPDTLDLWRQWCFPQGMITTPARIRGESIGRGKVTSWLGQGGHQVGPASSTFPNVKGMSPSGLEGGHTASGYITHLFFPPAGEEGGCGRPSCAGGMEGRHVASIILASVGPPLLVAGGSGGGACSAADTTAVTAAKLNAHKRGIQDSGGWAGTTHRLERCAGSTKEGRAESSLKAPSNCSSAIWNSSVPHRFFSGKEEKEQWVYKPHGWGRACQEEESIKTETLNCEPLSGTCYC